MAAITEDYVSFEIAKLLKEKGFEGYSIFTIYDENAANAYIKELKEKHLPYNSDDPKLKEFYYTKPTLQMAMKWLREAHNIHTEICLYKTNEDDIEPKKSRKAPYYTFGVWDTVTGNNVDKRLTNDFIGDTYEEACEAAIKYCLENLI